MTGQQDALLSVAEVKLQAEQVHGQLDVFDALNALDHFERAYVLGRVEVAIAELRTARARQ